MCRYFSLHLQKVQALKQQSITVTSSPSTKPEISLLPTLSAASVLSSAASQAARCERLLVPGPEHGHAVTADRLLSGS